MVLTTIKHIPLLPAETLQESFRRAQENPESLVSTMLASPHSDLRHLALKAIPSPRQVLLPLLYKLSDPNWQVRDAITGELFKILRQDILKATSAASSLIPNLQETPSAPLLTISSLLHYGSRPVVAKLDPCYTPLNPRSQVTSEPETSRLHARASIMRIMQRIAEAYPDPVPLAAMYSPEQQAAKEILTLLKQDLQKTLRFEIQHHSLNPITESEVSAMERVAPRNPLSDPRPLPFVVLLQKASIYYSNLSKIRGLGESERPAGWEAHLVKEENRISPMIKTIRTITFGERDLAAHLVCPRERRLSPSDFE